MCIIVQAKKKKNLKLRFPKHTDLKSKCLQMNDTLNILFLLKCYISLILFINNSFKISLRQTILPEFQISKTA